MMIYLAFHVGPIISGQKYFFFEKEDSDDFCNGKSGSSIR